MRGVEDETAKQKMQMKMFNQSLPKNAEGKVIIANRTEINVCLRISGIIEFYNFFGENGARRVGSMGGWRSSEPRESFRSPVQIKPRAHNVVAKQHCAQCICFVPLKVRKSLFGLLMVFAEKHFRATKSIYRCSHHGKASSSAFECECKKQEDL